MGNSTSSPNFSPRKPSIIRCTDMTRRSGSKSCRVPISSRGNGHKSSVKPTLSTQSSDGFDEVHKSQSMYELRHRHPSHSLSHQNSVRHLSPGNTVEASDADATAALTSSRFASTSLYPSMVRQKSFRRPDPTHPICAAGRDIIRTCFENPHLDLANRICSRVFEKRADYQRFVLAMGKDKWPLVTNNLQNYLEEVVAHVDSHDEVQQLSRRYGEEHVQLKAFGFKPDMWVALADATTVECVILDMASHQPTDTVTAWSQLVSIMFSAIRDGYYNALRAQRMSTRKSFKRQESGSATSAQDLSEGSATNPPGSPVTPNLNCSPKTSNTVRPDTLLKPIILE